MSVIPGWDSVAGSHWWSNIYFWGSIFALILLGITEIVSHRYSERKDELATAEQSSTQRRHDVEVARLHLAVAEANLETARQGRANAIAVNAALVTSELLAFAGHLRNREDLSDSARVCLLVPQFEPFAGKQFDALTTSNDINAETFLNSLRHTLMKAGWIEVVAHEQPSADDGSVSGTRIVVDGSKDPTLLSAALSVEAALKAEGIAAFVTQKPETDAANANVIHILVGPKAE